MYSNFKGISQDVGGSQDILQTLMIHLKANVWHNLTERDGEK